MTDFAHLIYPDTPPEDDFDRATDILNKIDAQALLGHDILTEIEGDGSPTIKAMLLEAEKAYIEAVKGLIDVNPFESEKQKELFIQLQNDARRYRDMVSWLEKYLDAWRRHEGFNQDEEVQRMRRERERDEQPTG